MKTKSARFQVTKLKSTSRTKALKRDKAKHVAKRATGASSSTVKLPKLPPINGKRSAAKDLKPALKIKQVLKKVKQKESKLREKTEKLTSKLDGMSIQDLIKQADSGAVTARLKVIRKDGPKSEEDYRLEYVQQLAKLDKIEAALFNDYEINANGRAVYQLLQVLQQKNAVFDALWDLKSVDSKVAAVATRILEPAFRKVTATVTEILQAVRALLKKQVKSAEAEKIDALILDLIRARSGDIQEHYDHAVEQTAVVAQEDL